MVAPSPLTTSRKCCLPSGTEGRALRPGKKSFKKSIDKTNAVCYNKYIK